MIDCLMLFVPIENFSFMSDFHCALHGLLSIADAVNPCWGLKPSAIGDCVKEFIKSTRYLHLVVRFKWSCDSSRKNNSNWFCLYTETSKRIHLSITHTFMNYSWQELSLYFRGKILWMFYIFGVFQQWRLDSLFYLKHHRQSHLF